MKHLPHPKDWNESAKACAEFLKAEPRMIEVREDDLELILEGLDEYWITFPTAKEAEILRKVLGGLSLNDLRRMGFSSEEQDLIRDIELSL